MKVAPTRGLISNLRALRESAEDAQEVDAHGRLAQQSRLVLTTAFKLHELWAGPEGFEPMNASVDDSGSALCS